MRQKWMTVRNGIGAGVIASVALHLAVGTALLVNIPFDMPKPETEETVSVEIVPPPEPETAPEEKPPEEEQAKLEVPPPETQTEAPEPQQPPPPTEEQAAEQAPENAPAEPPPPETAPEPQQEQASAQPPPPPAAPEPPPPAPEAQPEPPPPPAGEEAQAEEPPAAAEEQQAAEQAEQQPAGEEGQGQSPLPVLRPVFEFGEKDGGPRIAEDGNAATDEEMAAEEVPEEVTDEATETAAAADGDAEAEQPAEELADGPSSETESDTPETEVAAGDPVPSDVEAPSVDFGGASAALNGAGGTADDGKAGILAAEKPKGEGEQTEKPTDEPESKPPALKEAKRLFSRSETNDAMAMTAMNGMPREMRAGELCATELREQLVRATPRYRPEMIPSYKLPRGTVMDARRAAFRSGGQWYDLQFRCELDEKVTKVVSFAFEVGAPVPRSQWRERRFPSF